MSQKVFLLRHLHVTSAHQLRVHRRKTPTNEKKTLSVSFLCSIYIVFSGKIYIPEACFCWKVTKDSAEKKKAFWGKCFFLYSHNVNWQNPPSLQTILWQSFSKFKRRGVHCYLTKLASFAKERINDFFLLIH